MELEKSAMPATRRKDKTPSKRKVNASSS